MTDALLAKAVLAALSPRGVWRPPLSPQQIQDAITFGQDFYSDLASLAEDPYDHRMTGAITALISLGTAFSRIAAYAGLCARTGEKPDMAFIEGVIFQSDLSEGFMMRIMSPHRLVSILHLSDGQQQRMGNVTREKKDKLWHETCTFPYPRDLSAPQDFEVFVPGALLLWGKGGSFTLPFGELH